MDGQSTAQVVDHQARHQTRTPNQNTRQFPLRAGQYAKGPSLPSFIPSWRLINLLMAIAICPCQGLIKFRPPRATVPPTVKPTPVSFAEAAKTGLAVTKKQTRILGLHESRKGIARVAAGRGHP